MKFILTTLISYLFGSIPWGLVIGLVFFKKDIRKEGSGNIGGTNTGRVLGKPIGLTVILLDAIKGFLSMWIASLLTGGNPLAIILAGCACCIGHCFPIFIGFNGGKAVATTYGYLLGLCTFLHFSWIFQLIVPFAVFMLVLYARKMVSLASILSIFVAAIMAFFTGNNILAAISILLLWILVTYRHKANIERIKNGTESKISWMG